MKKKYIALMALPLLCGCTHPAERPAYVNVDVSWKQKGGDCIYTEKRELRFSEWDSLSYSYNGTAIQTAENTIKYGNTSCEKVISEELKNKTNKSALENYFNQINSVSTTNVTTQMQQVQ